MNRRRCTHDPNSPWAYAGHRNRNERPCKAALAAYARYMRSYRARTGRTKHRLVPNKEDS